MRERILVIRAEGEQARGIRALEPRYPDLEFVYCESFLSGIVEASRGGVRAMLARVDGGPRKLTEAVGALREAGGRETKIVLCCAPEHEPQAQEALAGGADDYVIEPMQAADVDRAIGYPRIEQFSSSFPPQAKRRDLEASFSSSDTSGSPLGKWIAAEPVASMEELAGLGDLLGLMDGPPRAMLQRAADLIREAMGASGATIVVQGSVAQCGEAGRTVLTAVLHDGERVIGQVSVGERNAEESKGRKVETRRDEGTEGQRDGGETRGVERKVEESKSRKVKTRSGGAIPSSGAAYTLGDAQKLEQYAGVVSRVIAAAGRQRELKRLSVMDEASGLPNRRYLRQQLGAILERAAAERFPVTVLLFDVDDFKSYNDRYGHDAGDEILRVTGELFRKNCREQDVVARYGGDEFAVVFYDPQGPREAGSKPPAEALFVLDRFKDELARVNVRTSERQNVKTEGVRGRASGAGDKVVSALQPERHSTITISGGLATYPWDGNTVDGLLKEADQALLAAKRAGKNRIFVVGQ